MPIDPPPYSKSTSGRVNDTSIKGSEMEILASKCLGVWVQTDAKTNMVTFPRKDMNLQSKLRPTQLT